MNVNDAQCPRCLAKPGRLCFDVDLGGEPEAAHAERQTLARLGPCPRCGAPVGDPCYSKSRGILLLVHWPRVECLVVSCGYCWAVAGDRCTTSDGQACRPHKIRLDAGRAPVPV